MIKLYNTKTRRKEDFVPIDENDVRMYVCGPTVYDRAHIGNARPVVVFDTLYRLLRHEFGKDKVRYARNFTDVDDKINAKAAETGRSIRDITDETIGWYLDDMGALGALEPTVAPRATEYIAEMIAMISELIEKGHAYAAEGHALFDVNSYEKYGSLSGRSVDDMIAGARVEIAPYKQNPMDFVLWKPSTGDQPGWESPWGYGRPGWHIECSAMARALFGDRFDIHGGGLDLQFPHHENEIAQSCACCGDDSFANVWMHNEMLQVEGKKMSKSLGNFFSVRELLDQGYAGEVIRFVYLSTHYSKPMDWTDKKAKEAESVLRKIARLLGGDPLAKPWPSNSTAGVPLEFVDALSNDLNTSLALTLIKKYLKNKDEAKLKPCLKLLGFEPDVIRGKFLNFELEASGNSVVHGESLRTYGSTVDFDGKKFVSLGKRLKDLRDMAMITKDFSEVDGLKTALLEAGVEVQMSKDDMKLSAGPNYDPSKLEALL